MATRSSYGADFLYENPAGNSTFTSFGTVVGISLSGPTRGSFSTAALTDASPYKSFLPTRSDAGEVTFSLRFVNGGATFNTIVATLFADQDASRDYRVAFGDGTNTDTLFTCAGFITAAGSDFPDEGDDGITHSLTVKLSGAPTIALST